MKQGDGEGGSGAETNLDVGAAAWASVSAGEQEVGGKGGTGGDDRNRRWGGAGRGAEEREETGWGEGGEGEPRRGEGEGGGRRGA